MKLFLVRLLLGLIGTLIGTGLGSVVDGNINASKQGWRAHGQADYSAESVLLRQDADGHTSSASVSWSTSVRGLFATVSAADGAAWTPCCTA